MSPLASPLLMLKKLFHAKTITAKKPHKGEDPLIHMQRHATRLVRNARAATAKHRKAALVEQKALAKQEKLAAKEKADLKKQALNDLKRRNDRDRQILKEIDAEWEWSSIGARTPREFLLEKFNAIFERDPAAPKRTFSNSGCSVASNIEDWRRDVLNWQNGAEYSVYSSDEDGYESEESDESNGYDEDDDYYWRPTQKIIAGTPYPTRGRQRT